MTLYIYRVGGLAPQEILLQDLNLLKALVVLRLCLDRSDRSYLPVRPVIPTGQTGRLLPDRLHRHRPVRPPGATGQTGWSSLLPILVVNTFHFARRSHILMLYPHKSSLAGCLFLVISVSACPASFLSSYQLPAKLAKIMLLRWEMHAEEPNA